ncbi:hypothetical protein RRG08_066228 [Elysia crispata]|uniref:Uncharacterized protein n=1 Tax=Elysia crispata TaxID=231223 RepID=A0AAE1BD72_9GAST|nr:hypothetical protein RRG08_066228 [Elysia crispata]
MAKFATSFNSTKKKHPCLVQCKVTMIGVAVFNNYWVCVSVCDSARLLSLEARLEHRLWRPLTTVFSASRVAAPSCSTSSTGGGGALGLWNPVDCPPQVRSREGAGGESERERASPPEQGSQLSSATYYVNLNKLVNPETTVYLRFTGQRFFHPVTGRPVLTQGSEPPPSDLRDHQLTPENLAERKLFSVSSVVASLVWGSGLLPSWTRLPPLTRVRCGRVGSSRGGRLGLSGSIPFPKVSTREGVYHSTVSGLHCWERTRNTSTAAPGLGLLTTTTTTTRDWYLNHETSYRRPSRALSKQSSSVDNKHAPRPHSKLPSLRLHLEPPPSSPGCLQALLSGVLVREIMG